MATQLKLLAGTVVLTVIIWVYADQSSHGDYVTQVLVRIVPPSPGDILPVVETTGVRVSGEPSIARVRAQFTGPKAAINRLSSDDRGGNLQFQVRTPEDWTASRHTLSLIDALNRSPDVRERGLYVTAVWPSTVEVSIDHWTTTTFRVQANAGPLAASLAGPIVIRPATVEGRLRQSQLERLGTKEPVVIVPVQEWLREAQGTIGPIAVPLPRTVQDVPVEFVPGQVEFTATLTQRTVQKRLSPIALNVLLNPDLMGQYRVVWADEADRVQSINVRVPVDRAESLLPENVQAFIVISREDAIPKTGGGAATRAQDAESWITRTVQFVFPPGYQEVQIEGPPPAVRIRVVEALSPTAPVARMGTRS